MMNENNEITSITFKILRSSFILENNKNTGNKNPREKSIKSLINDIN